MLRDASSFPHFFSLPLCFFRCSSAAPVIKPLATCKNRVLPILIFACINSIVSLRDLVDPSCVLYRSPSQCHCVKLKRHTCITVRMALRSLITISLIMFRTIYRSRAAAAVFPPNHVFSQFLFSLFVFVGSSPNVQRRQT